jgi:hypothetical protein
MPSVRPSRKRRPPIGWAGRAVLAPSRGAHAYRATARLPRGGAWRDVLFAPRRPPRSQATLALALARKVRHRTSKQATGREADRHGPERRRKSPRGPPPCVRRRRDRTAHGASTLGADPLLFKSLLSLGVALPRDELVQNPMHRLSGLSRGRLTMFRPTGRSTSGSYRRYGGVRGRNSGRKDEVRSHPAIGVLLHIRPVRAPCHVAGRAGSTAVPRRRAERVRAVPAASRGAHAYRATAR